MEKSCVFFEVRTEFLNAILKSFGIKGLLYRSMNWNCAWLKYWSVNQAAVFQRREQCSCFRTHYMSLPVPDIVVVNVSRYLINSVSMCYEAGYSAQRTVGVWSGVIPAVPLGQWRELKPDAWRAFTPLTPEEFPCNEPHALFSTQREANILGTQLFTPVDKLLSK
jgi:hypothetical protein